MKNLLKIKYKLKKWKYHFWDEMNPEGIRGKDAFFMFCFVIGNVLFWVNLTMWLSNPEQSWIGNLLFPMKP